MRQYKGSSVNFDALLALVESKNNYFVSVADKYISDGEEEYLHSYEENGTYGVTLMPGSSKDSSPDNNVYVIISSSLSEFGQALNTSHELYGHAYLYELKHLGWNVSPYHDYSIINGASVFDEETQMTVTIARRIDNNIDLVKQIYKSQQETVLNYLSQVSQVI